MKFETCTVVSKVSKELAVYIFNIQGEHKVFPWLQTFITRKLRGIQTHFFFSKCNSTQEVFYNFFYNTLVHLVKKYVCIPRSFLVINVRNQGKTLCSPCTSCIYITQEKTQNYVWCRR